MLEASQRKHFAMCTSQWESVGVDWIEFDSMRWTYEYERVVSPRPYFALFFDHFVAFLHVLYLISIRELCDATSLSFYAFSVRAVAPRISPLCEWQSNCQRMLQYPRSGRQAKIDPSSNIGFRG